MVRSVLSFVKLANQLSEADESYTFVFAMNNCIAKWRLGVWDAQGLPVEASQSLD